MNRPPLVARTSSRCAGEPERSEAPRVATPQQQLLVEGDRHALRRGIADRPQRRHVGLDALIDAGRGQPEHVPGVERGLRAGVHPRLTGVGVDQPRRAARPGQGVAQLGGPQRPVAHEPGAALRVSRVKDTMTGEVHDVVVAIAEQPAQAVSGHELVNVDVSEYLAELTGEDPPPLLGAQNSPGPPPTLSPGKSFGIEELVLVDAKSRDIPGALDCDPVNRCFGSATRFNVRAKTFGHVRSVLLTSHGPIKESGRVEGRAPYAVWGDDGKGDYKRKELKPGIYTVTAQATDDRGQTAAIFSKTFHRGHTNIWDCRSRLG